MSQLKPGESQFTVYACEDEDGHEREDAFEVFDRRAENQVEVYDREEDAEDVCAILNQKWADAGSPTDGIDYTAADYQR